MRDRDDSESYYIKSVQKQKTSFTCDQLRRLVTELRDSKELYQT